MNAHTLLAAGAAALVSAASFAQQAREGERPPRPDSASNAAIGGWCDALTGAKKEECLRDERKRLARELHDDINQRLALLAISWVRANG